MCLRTEPRENWQTAQKKVVDFGGHVGLKHVGRGASLKPQTAWRGFDTVSLLHKTTHGSASAFAFWRLDFLSGNKVSPRELSSQSCLQG